MGFRRTTDRLTLREFEVEDAAALFRLRADPEVNRHTGEPLAPDVESVARDILAYPDYRQHGFGRWACALRTTGEVIGFCGLKYLPELDEVDLGYRFVPEHWGRGYATESGRAALEVGAELGLREVTAYVLPANLGSVRVLDKLGFRRAGEQAFDGLTALRFSRAL